ncbi:MAG: ERAP1-like C-terminal domain-containing protein, partial [Telluria sp.]
MSESFASFMASLAMTESPQFKHAWLSFFIDDKQRGYALDAGPGSHPVDAAIASSANAYDNLDAITYIKGGSALKQLRHLLGDEVFRTGVHNYLVKNQFGNAQLDDFIGELGKAAGRDLGPWTKQWLYDAGLNTITADYTCRKGKIATFLLRQGTARAGQTVLREQRVQVATFVRMKGSMALNRNVAVNYQGASTRVPALVGSACPDLVYPNYQEWGFVKVQLDQRSMATARSQMGAISDPLQRAMLWQGLWDGARDGGYPLATFMATAMQHARAEKDDAVLRDLLKKIEEGAAFTPAPPSSLPQAAWQAMQASSDTDFKARWLKLYQNPVSDKAGLERLAGVLSGAVVIEGVPLNQDLRWNLIATLNRHDHVGSLALIATELARDNSDSGRSAALRATVLRPDPAIKAEWLAKIGDSMTTESFAR